MTLQYHDISLADKPAIDALLARGNWPGCEYNFTSMFIWRKVRSAQVAYLNDTAVVRMSYFGKLFVLFPLDGARDAEAIAAVLADEQARETAEFSIYGLPRETAQWVADTFPRFFAVRNYPNASEYLYRVEDLIHLSGKKYHGKRNHIARFRASDWAAEQLTPEHIAECMQMHETWFSGHPNRESRDLCAEHEAVNQALTHFSALGLDGMLLRQNGRVVAFSLGQPQNDDTYLIHIEKAYHDVEGAYQSINQAMAEAFASSFAQINREDDAGDLGLRRAKQSYHPVAMLDCYCADYIRR